MIERLMARWNRETNSSHAAPSFESAQARIKPSTDIDEWRVNTTPQHGGSILHERTLETAQHGRRLEGAKSPIWITQVSLTPGCLPQKGLFGPLSYQESWSCIDKVAENPQQAFARRVLWRLALECVFVTGLFGR